MTNDVPINFLCSACGKSLTAKPKLMGRQRACPICKVPITVPFLTDATQLLGQPSVPLPPPPPPQPPPPPNHRKVEVEDKGLADRRAKKLAPSDGL